MKKVLLLGKSGVGKTSMHSVIFANCPIKDTTKIGYTVGRQQHNFIIMGKLKMNLNDCGGQDEFMEEYFWSQKQTVFKNVSVVIFVFDVLQQQKQKLEKTYDYWNRTLKCLQKLSPDAHIFTLIHKMDMIKKSQKIKKFNQKKQVIQDIANKAGMKVTNFFATTLYDQSLYESWSYIVQYLIPNRQSIQKMLRNFCKASSCTQAVLFQKETFLILSHVVHNQQKPNQTDIQRCQQVAILIKQLKLTANKLGAKINSIQVKYENFSGLIQQFTPTQFILIVNDEISDDYHEIKSRQENQKIVLINIKIMGKQFEKMKNKLYSQ